jgi:hypothetical protein
MAVDATKNKHPYLYEQFSVFRIHDYRPLHIRIGAARMRCRSFEVEVEVEVEGGTGEGGR